MFTRLAEKFPQEISERERPGETPVPGTMKSCFPLSLLSLPVVGNVGGPGAAPESLVDGGERNFLSGVHLEPIHQDSGTFPALGLNPGPLLSLGVTARHDLWVDHDLGLSLCLAVTSQE